MPIIKNEIINLKKRALLTELTHLAAEHLYNKMLATQCQFKGPCLVLTLLLFLPHLHLHYQVILLKFALPLPRGMHQI